MDIDLKPVKDETFKRLMALPKALRSAIVPEALKEIGVEIHAAAIDKLSGARVLTGRGFNRRSVNPGQYPVNVVTGHLRRSESSIGPGRKGLTNFQIAEINTANYSAVIHDGRPFIDDAILDTDIDGILNEHMEAAL